MAIDSSVLGEVVNALKQEPENKNRIYRATVSRIDNEGVVWVNLAGSDIETPTEITSAEVHAGDSVNVEWRNNQLYIGGNYSNPSAGVARVEKAESKASYAQSTAENAQAIAEEALANSGGSGQESAYFWYQDGSGTHAGAHVTEVPKETFISNPQGGNVLIKSSTVKVRNGTSANLAEFGASGIQLGQTGESHVNLDYHSLRMIDKEGNYYVYLSDLRDATGIAQLIESFDGDGTTTTFSLSFNCVSVDTVKINNTTTTAYTVSGNDVTFTTAPASGSFIEIIYNSDTSEAKAFTFGTRDTGYVGVMSFADGLDNLAEGYCSHASGNMVYANGHYSKAGGVYSEANNTGANAQGLYVVANGKWQTVIGRFNDTQTNTLFEIGNGTADNARSNAFTVDKNGGVVAGALVESSGTYTGGYNDEALMTLATRNKWHTILGEATE